MTATQTTGRRDTLDAMFDTGVIVSPKNRDRVPQPELVRRGVEDEFFVPSETHLGMFHRVEVLQGFAATCSGCDGNRYRGYCHHRIDVQALLTQDAVNGRAGMSLVAQFGVPIEPVEVK